MGAIVLSRTILVKYIVHKQLVTIFKVKNTITLREIHMVIFYLDLNRVVKEMFEKECSTRDKAKSKWAVLPAGGPHGSELGQV